VIHQCGAHDLARCEAAAAALPERLKGRYRVMGFVGEEIGDVYALADVIVGRSGAGTVTEAAALGKPALFVPLVPTGGDEQTRNARRAADAGSAIIIPQAELSAERLGAALRPLLADPARRAAMEAAARTLARPQAAQDLAQAVLTLAYVV
jgi:UDP-N-acetylglucosamine--N-acetylmuramyl-(pentapeptide) pyrophosphoryl-undecaprenol N-acetylglucosamine transferase